MSILYCDFLMILTFMKLCVKENCSKNTYKSTIQIKNIQHILQYMETIQQYNTIHGTIHGNFKVIDCL